MVSNTKEFASAGPRRQKLARLVASRGFVRVADASLELGVSDVTIRGDLSALELAGSVVRVHGGAMPTSAIVDPESPLEASVDRDADAKLAIGRAAAALVSSGESVYVDAGSTAMALAASLVDRRELHDVIVVTPGLTIALALEAALPRFTVIVTGGTLRPLQHSLVNPFAAPMIDSLNLDWAFIGCNGVDARLGATNVNLPEAEIKTRVLARSRHRVLIADGSKLGRADLAVIAPLAEFETLVTAGEAEPGILAELGSAGLAVIRG
jgi:DeoR family transcriptional regulator of aga operon